MLEYKVIDFSGAIAWIRYPDKFLVDPIYVDDFKKEYPDAEESIKGGRGKRQ